MKIKQHIHITDPIAFAKGNYDSCLTLFGSESPVEGWIYAGEVELEINVDQQTAVLAAKAALDEREQEIRAEMNARLQAIETARYELLAITHEPEHAA